MEKGNLYSYASPLASFASQNRTMGKVSHPLVEEAPPYSWVYLKELETWAEEISRYSHIVVVGAGGSIATPRAVLSLVDSRDQGKIIFLEQLDSLSLKQSLSSLGQGPIALVAISKSSLTLETGAICQFIIDYWAKISPCQVSCYLIGGDLGGVWQGINWAKIIEYRGPIGGRFSPFCLPSLLLLKIVGADIEGYCLGGAKALAHYPYLSSLEGMAPDSPEYIIATAANYGWINVDMSYSQALCHFSTWRATLMVETLGKAGARPIVQTVPLPYGQHSYLQPYLQCNLPLLLRFLKPREPEVIPTISQAQEACWEAILSHVNQAEIPHQIQYISLGQAEEVGYLFMKTMLETIVTGQILGLDPFSQEAIDSIKKEAFTKWSQVNNIIDQ